MQWGHMSLQSERSDGQVVGCSSRRGVLKFQHAHVGRCNPCLLSRRSPALRSWWRVDIKMFKCKEKLGMTEADATTCLQPGRS